MSGGLFQGGHGSLPHSGGGGNPGGGGGHPGGGMDGIDPDLNQGMEQGVNPLLCFLCHQVRLVGKNCLTPLFYSRLTGSHACWLATTPSVPGASRVAA